MLSLVLNAAETGDLSTVLSLWNTEIEDALAADPRGLADLLHRACRNPPVLSWVIKQLSSRNINLSSSAELWHQMNCKLVWVDDQPSLEVVDTEELLVQRVETALNAFKKGEFLVVFDSKDRENEGDLIIAAQFCTPEKVAFMVRHTSGLICVPTVAARIDELGIPLMVHEKHHSEYHGTAFTVSIDFKHGTSTGISAEDRSKTIMAMAQPDKYSKEDFVRPGHIFPLRSKDGGILKRPGHTEAATDLCILSGLYPAAAICEITKL